MPDSTMLMHTTVPGYPLHLLLRPGGRREPPVSAELEPPDDEADRTLRLPVPVARAVPAPR